MEVPRLGVELKPTLQPQQRRILNPLSEARDGTSSPRTLRWGLRPLSYSGSSVAVILNTTWSAGGVKRPRGIAKVKFSGKIDLGRGWRGGEAWQGPMGPERGVSGPRGHCSGWGFKQSQHNAPQPLLLGVCLLLLRTSLPPRPDWPPCWGGVLLLQQEAGARADSSCVVV